MGSKPDLVAPRVIDEIPTLVLALVRSTRCLGMACAISVHAGFSRVVFAHVKSTLHCWCIGLGLLAQPSRDSPFQPLCTFQNLPGHYGEL